MSIEQFAPMDRRSLMRHAILLVSASMATGACDMLPGAGNDPDFAFDADQLALLTAIAGTIIPQTDTPGAVEAGVPATFEALLRDWASAQTREDILAAMERVDAAAQGGGFAGLDETGRFDVLLAHDAQAREPDPEGVPPPRTNPFVSAGPPERDPGYALMRRLLVTLYYYSEIGLTQELAYEHNPGVWEPSIPVTPETRPWGGVGLF